MFDYLLAYLFNWSLLSCVVKKILSTKTHIRFQQHVVKREVTYFRLAIAKVLPTHPVGDDEIGCGWDDEEGEVFVVSVLGQEIEELWDLSVE